VEPFIADMARAYAWADLVLCRAGGSSIAELTAAGLPAVLVPFPLAAQDHQRHNARFLEREGAGIVVEQARFFGPEGDPKVLAEVLLGLFRDREKLARMAERSRAAAKPHAAADVVNGLEALLTAS
ncbi:MAG: UDP-N-acetylglucosamine--N-acetylmuramyl-(pentapeptide) pyrophosphoryl-undecaprenol N-acetylglucosamine transferase, partial [Desulfovibrio sp.]|jgi:UDP-N-acetylglucosamine--N-acetylmuramyl-(pentapeptide) pyrophosphoryl-undecaprenol N-acetylglucosamine transferase|nr:UDP-N-acetylglucosamine--N-acetylmuramyl-(pentapeptide) pyrophosphoryl-undecaprenol N-acetylglucosamine transferase [Desulfovibrio sp.]